MSESRSERLSKNPRSQRLESLRRKTLRVSQIECTFYALMVGSSETFALYYAVSQGLNKHEIAIVSTIPVLLGAIANWIVPHLTPNESLKKILLTSIGVQICGLLGLFLSLQVSEHFWSILTSLSLYWIGGMAASPIWMDWISGWLPNDRMGRYLSRRNSYIAMVTLFAYMFLAFCIYKNPSRLAFQAIFGIAVIARMISLILLSRQDSPLRIKTHQQSPTMSFADCISSKPILVTIIGTTVFRFVCNLASPFFLPYMLSNLHFSLLDYAWLTTVPFIGRWVFLAQWGEATRSFRPFIGLQIAMFALSLVALGWTFTENIFGLSSIEIFSGVFWGGFELCMLLILQSFSPGNSRSLVGFSLALNNLAAVGGALVGSLLLEAGWPYLRLFRTCAALRFTVAMLFLLSAIRLMKMMTPLKAYSEFLSTALSLRSSIAYLSRLMPSKKSK